MKVDLAQLKQEIEEELKAIEERRTVLAKSLDQITAIEALVSYRRDGSETVTLSRFPHFERALSDEGGSEKKPAGKGLGEEDDEPQVRIDWIQAGAG